MRVDVEVATVRMGADAEGAVATTGVEIEGVVAHLLLKVGTRAMFLREDPLTRP